MIPCQFEVISVGWSLTLAKAYEVENRQEQVCNYEEHLSETGGVLTDLLAMHLQELLLVAMHPARHHL